MSNAIYFIRDSRHEEEIHYHARACSSPCLGQWQPSRLRLSSRPQKASAVDDPRQAPPIVRLVTAAPVNGSDRKFTGTVGARVQSNLGFRVPGKIVERMVDVGQQVRQGQALMRIDETDLHLALTAKRNAVAAARAVLSRRTQMRNAMRRW